MCDDWMPLIRLPLSIEQFRQLPRNAAYRYEFLGGQASLSPRPRHYHALLDLQPMEVDRTVTMAPARAADLADLAELFAGAFRYIQPYGSLDEMTRLEAARQALERTRTGGDGPLIEPASFIAGQGERTVGAILITLLPAGDPCDWDSYHWNGAPPADCIARRLGRPHLTWIFVSPLEAGHGIGTALLAEAVRALRAMGFTQLLSTFMVGNDSSMLWHWRNGFRLLSYPGSYRLMVERWRREQQSPLPATLPPPPNEEPPF
jgi:GNAT superfamily N-acetyltransferase